MLPFHHFLKLGKHVYNNVTPWNFLSDSCLNIFWITTWTDSVCRIRTTNHNRICTYEIIPLCSHCSHLMRHAACRVCMTHPYVWNHSFTIEEIRNNFIYMHINNFIMSFCLICFSHKTCLLITFISRNYKWLDLYTHKQFYYVIFVWSVSTIKHVCLFT